MNFDQLQPSGPANDEPKRDFPDFESASPLFAVSPDPLTDRVLVELQQEPQQKTWGQALVLLAVTLFFFSASGLLSYSLPELLLLLGVLLFHEMGHYLGMRLFNYQDVRMFFIPFFGAAVSGRPTSVAGYKEAIVILLGPLPGILLGLVLGVACLFYDNELLRSTSRVLLFLNVFNLLPFLPLDGGRLLHLVLFSRQRHIEAVFRFATGGLLAIGGIMMREWFLSAIGAFIALSTFHTFRVSTLAQKLRGQHAPAAEMNLSAQIPPEQAVPLVTAVRRAFPQLKQSKPLANTARQVWERMHVEPPGVLASVTLLGVYVAALVIPPLILVLFLLPMPRVVSHVRADGTHSKVEEVRVWGELRASTELNADRQYHGRHLEFSPRTGRIAVEGQYLDGDLDGIWSFYEPDGRLLGTAHFKEGQLVEKEGKIPGFPDQ